MTNKTTSAIDLVTLLQSWVDGLDGSEERGMLQQSIARINAQSDTITRLQAALEWRPIETAPPGRAPILLYQKGHLHEITVGGRSCLGSDDFINNGWPAKPTHWMPLPEPPALSSVRGE